MKATKGSGRESSIPVSPSIQESKKRHFRQTFCPNRHVFRKDILLYFFSNYAIWEAWNHADLCKTSICFTAAGINLWGFFVNTISSDHVFVLFHKWIPGKLWSFTNFTGLYDDSFLVINSPFFSCIDTFSLQRTDQGQRQTGMPSIGQREAWGWPWA